MIQNVVKFSEENENFRYRDCDYVLVQNSLRFRANSANLQERSLNVSTVLSFLNSAKKYINISEEFKKHCNSSLSTSRCCR